MCIRDRFNNNVIEEQAYNDQMKQSLLMLFLYTDNFKKEHFKAGLNQQGSHATFEQLMQYKSEQYKPMDYEFIS